MARNTHLPEGEGGAYCGTQWEGEGTVRTPQISHPLFFPPLSRQAPSSPKGEEA